MNILMIKDLPIAVGELEQTEMAQIAGGMINLGYHHPTHTDDATWVSEGNC
jgi:hypothetical protein